jgi:dipeptidyl aminopeptidase/acylaminoacyl peptidase
MTPDGKAPDGGWPTAMLFQGSFHSAADMWTAKRDDDFGGFNQTLLVRTLLEHGYAVLTPETRLAGDTYWETNVLPWAYLWDSSEDHDLMEQIFAAVDAGSFGPLEPHTMFAAGISSGGYMTSRMAIQYADRFRALAIESASYATCAGPICDVPDDLPTNHPPTLFLHGNDDDIVPIATAWTYHDKLAAKGVMVDFVVDETAGHRWIDAAPSATLAFFDSNH